MAPPTYRWTLAALVPVVVVFLAGLANDSVFTALGLEPMKPVFSDTVAILAAGEAHEAGLNVYVSNPLDPFGRPHVYGSIWLLGGKLGLVRADAWWLGTLLAASFLAGAGRVLAPRGRGAALAAAVLLASPGVLLGLQRANNDLVVFLLLAAAAALAARPRLAAGVAAGAVVALAMLLKVYPLAALPALAARPGPRRRAIGLTLVVGLVLAAILALDWADVQRVRQLAPDRVSLYSYGIRLPYTVLTTIPAARFLFLGGALPVLIGAACVFWRRRESLVTAVPASGFTAACFVAGAASWLFCYLLTMSFPYRLVLLLLPARLWLSQLGDARHRFMAVVSLAGTAAFFWLGAAKEFELVTAGDMIVSGPPPLWLILGLEQAIGFALAAGLVLNLFGWARRAIAD